MSDDCQLCPTGKCYYCTQCTSPCCHCSIGSYCPGDGRQYICPSGTYNPLNGSTAAANCTVCPRGMYSLAGSTVCTYRVSTFAGIGVGGYTGDNNFAVYSKLSQPSGVYVDKFTNVYIADTNNHRIRVVSVTSDYITTVAGTGTSCSGTSCNDGVIATSAYLNYPRDVFVDTVGNMYIADTNDHRIRIVYATTGVIATIVGTGVAGSGGDGGAATSAGLITPWSVVYDGAETIYIADTYNNRIRKVFSAVISTIAGTGVGSYTGDRSSATSATLYNPTGVALDKSGNNLLIADRGNGCIRHLNMLTGMITTILGGTMPISSYLPGQSLVYSFQPVGVSVDMSGNIYVADGNSRIVKLFYPAAMSVNMSLSVAVGLPFSVVLSGSVSGVNSVARKVSAGDGGPSSSALLNGPSRAVVDSYGSIYIADTYNNKIRKMEGK